eukprot:4644078-Alexandrium_andersonii.AAC.1
MTPNPPDEARSFLEPCNSSAKQGSIRQVASQQDSKRQAVQQAASKKTQRGATPPGLCALGAMRLGTLPVP